MSYSSCIRQPENDRYIQIHAWQIRFCQENRCAAILLAFFTAWHDWKIKNDHYYRKSNNISEMHGDGRPHSEDAYLFFSTEELIEGCMGFYGKNTVNDALDLLVSLQVITVHKNPNPRYHFDKTRYFKFYPDICNRWLAKSHRVAIEESQECSQPIDFTDTPKEADRLVEKGLRSAEKGQPSAKRGRAITNTTNNTTNKNKSINTRVDLFEKENPKAELPPEQSKGTIQAISDVLLTRGFSSEELQYPDAIEAIQRLLDQGATIEHFEQAHNLCEQITRRRGKSFGVSYLIKAVSSQLETTKNSKTYYRRHTFTDPPDPPPKVRYENDFSKGLHWMGDLLEESNEFTTTS